jgi:hypothetical protein
LKQIGKVHVKTYLFVLCACIFQVRKSHPGGRRNRHIAVPGDFERHNPQGRARYAMRAEDCAISSSVSDKLHLNIQAFVTQEIEPPLVRMFTQLFSYLFIHEKGVFLAEICLNDSMVMAIFDFTGRGHC